jgi:protein-tyrosine phosphatase
MAQLTPSDYRYLSDLGVRVIVDFRSKSERADEPTRWLADPAPKIIAWDAAIQEDESPLIAALTAEDRSQEMVRSAMAQLYRYLPYVFADRYRKLFRVVESGTAPIVFHCSAGKDRAGVAAALLMTALGVPRDTIVEDYAMSDKVVDYMSLIDAADPQRINESSIAYLLQLPRDLLAPVLWSDPWYIITMFDELEKNHGSALAFLHDELNLTDQAIESLRARCLE